VEELAMVPVPKVLFVEKVLEVMNVFPSKFQIVENVGLAVKEPVQSVPSVLSIKL
jgi:hypothetical protein